MKKTISVLLSLLMLLGAMTCLFTAPVSAAEASETITAVTKDLFNGEGSFESYAEGDVLEANYTEVKKGTAPYEDYTGTDFRYYNPVPSTDGKWTGWDPNRKTSNVTAGIIADIEAAGGKVAANGLTGMTHYKNFATVVGTTTTPVYTDAGQHKSKRQDVSVTPYKGEKMLRLQLPRVSGFKEISGLTSGKIYRINFWVYNASPYYRLQIVEALSAPRGQAGGGTNAAIGVTLLRNETGKSAARFELPTQNVSETYTKGDGTEGTTTATKLTDDYYGKWAQVTLCFTATSDKAYLGLKSDYTGTANNTGYVYIDELSVTQVCDEHTFDSIGDAECNNCGAIREYPTSWNFENGSTQNIQNVGGTVEVVDAVDQPAKIGNKYLQFSTTYAGPGLTFNFEYEQGYKYIISYDFKVIDLVVPETTTNNNGYNFYITKYDDGKLENPTTPGLKAAALNAAADYVVTRYWENGETYNKVDKFNNTNTDSLNCYRENNTSNVMQNGGELWNEWQHFEIEVTNDDYTGLVEFSLRDMTPKASVVGFDNFKVEKVAVATINAADDAFDGTFAYNIRNNKAGTEQGLRFKSKINLNDLGNGAKIVEYGTLAYKKSDAGKTFLTREAAKDMAKNGYVVAGVAYDEVNDIDLRYEYDTETNVVTYTGVLTGIAPKYYKTEFNVRAYVVIETADGVRTTVYDNVQTLSVFSAATNIVNANADADDVAAARAALNAYNGVNA